MPALNNCGGTSLNDFTIKDIVALHSVVSQNRFQDLNTKALCQYLSLLVEADLFNLDIIYQAVEEKDKTFSPTSTPATKTTSATTKSSRRMEDSSSGSDTDSESESSESDGVAEDPRARSARLRQQARTATSS